MIQITGTLNPNESVKVVFWWTNDVSQSIEMAQSYQQYLRVLTETLAYTKDANIELLPLLPGDSEADEDEAAKNSGEEMSESNLLDIRSHGWDIAIERYSFNQPSIKEVKVVMWSTPDDAIKSSSVGDDKDKLKKTEEDDIIIHKKQATQWGCSSYLHKCTAMLGSTVNMK